MQITSPVFHHEGQIPSLYTCEGQNINPPLQIQNVPQEAKALVLIMDDPDVPHSLRKDGLWVHWVIYNIPPTTSSILENSSPPGIQGQGTGGKLGYQGPCPPDCEHRYYFKLYALSAPLKLQEGATKSEVEKSMEGMILEEAHLMGHYIRVK